ncbi:MAG TPA: hypothetical protein VKM35_10700, partial [Arenimonas sp.]|uniref:hypothetical protein n=1 Tax=Arenimonas sp. TaxID=1872635 RepID=UPI002B569334
AAHPPLMRANTSIDSQFFYSYTVATDSPVVVFIAEFRESFKILGYANAVEGWKKSVPEFVLPEFRSPGTWRDSHITPPIGHA